MTKARVPRRNAIIFFIFGILLVLVAAIFYNRVRTTLSTSIFTIAISAVLAGVVLRLVADALLRSRERLEVLQLVNMRANRGSFLFRWRRVDYLSLPQFFRLPPQIVDFQKSFVIRRPEVDEIIHELRRMRRGLEVIQGPPASGKTVLLYTLIFELSRRWWQRLRHRPVYVVTLKALTQDDLPKLKADLENVPRRSVVFVDDVHLYPSSLGLIAQQLQARKIVLVFITRLLSNYPREQVASIQDLRPRTYHLSAAAIADDIIHRFLSVKSINEERIAELKSLYEPYKHDLWALSTALEASDLSHSVPEISREAIDQWLISRFLRFEQRDGRLLDRATSLAAVAALYRFEVTAARDYLLRVVGVRLEDLNHLVAVGDILTATDNFYALYHSSLADLIVGALNSEIGSGLVPSSLRNKAQETGLRWPDAAILWHIESVKWRAVSTIVGVARASAAGREVALGLLHQLSGDHFVESIDSSLTDVETLGSFLALWSQTGRGLTGDMRKRFSLVLTEAPRQNVRSWSWLCYNVARIDLNLAMNFVDVLAELLPNESAGTIADIGTTMSYVSPALAVRALARSERSAVVAALRSEDLPPEELAKTFAKLVWVDPSFASAVGTTLLEMFPHGDASSFPTLLSRIAWGNEQVARSLLEQCEPASLLEIVRGAPDALARYRVFASIANVSGECARGLLDLGMTDWRDELGMQDLMTRVLDGVAEPDGVHTAKASDSLYDTFLEESRRVLIGKLRVSEQSSGLAVLRETCSPTDLLLLIATVDPDTRAIEDEVVSSWLNELLLECGGQESDLDAYRRCVGIVKEK